VRAQANPIHARRCIKHSRAKRRPQRREASARARLTAALAGIKRDKLFMAGPEQGKTDGESSSRRALQVETGVEFAQARVVEVVSTSSRSVMRAA
jgi:hypothetical protein